MQGLRKRSGCLSQLLLLALFCAVVYLAVIAITNPWIFTLGGHFRLLPFWQGVGDVEGPGGTYRIYVSIEPSSARSRVLPSTSVKGTGWICAPSGHSYRLKVGGGAHEMVWRDMNDKAFTLRVWQRDTWSTQHLPPKLTFSGRWIGPKLVMDDAGSTASAFLQDGSLNPRPGAAGPRRPVTFVETQWVFGNPCPAL